MKKKLLLAALLLVGVGAASQAHAAAYDWLFKLNDSVGSPYEFTVTGDGIHDAVLMYRPGGQLPYLAPLNGGLQLNGSNQLVIDNIPQSEITNLTTDLATINSSLSGKASASHTHAASDVTNFNPSVDARIASSTVPIGIQRTRALTDSSGVYTWTFPTAFAASTTPVIMVTAEDGTANVMTNAQVTSVSNTAVTVQVNQIAQVNLLSTLLGTGPTGIQKFVHITAVKP